MGRVIILALLACALVIAACDDDSVRVIHERYTGITRTNEMGEVLENDPDDWKDTSFLELRPAYPNPADRQISMELVTADTSTATVFIRTPTAIIRSFSFATRLKMTHRFTWDKRNNEGVRVGDGIYRVFVTVVDPQGKSHQSYGDILMDETAWR